MGVKVVGLGGCGRNSLNALIDLGFDSSCALNIDTDINAKSASAAPFLQIGSAVCHGRGAVEPSVGLAAAKESEDAIVKELSGAEVLIFIAGLGGGTGAGALPFIVSLVSVKTTVLAVMPAKIEGNRRRARAEAALANFRAAVGKDNVHVIEMAEGTPATIFDRTDKTVAGKIKALLAGSPAS